MVASGLEGSLMMDGSQSEGLGKGGRQCGGRRQRRPCAVCRPDRPRGSLEGRKGLRGPWPEPELEQTAVGRLRAVLMA